MVVQDKSAGTCSGSLPAVCRVYGAPASAVASAVGWWARRRIHCTTALHHPEHRAPTAVHPQSPLGCHSTCSQRGHLPCSGFFASLRRTRHLPTLGRCRAWSSPAAILLTSASSAKRAAGWSGVCHRASTETPPRRWFKRAREHLGRWTCNHDLDGKQSWRQSLVCAW